MCIIGKFSSMEISTVELQTCFGSKIFLPLFSLFIVMEKKVKVLIKVQNFDIYEREEMGMVRIVVG